MTTSNSAADSATPKHTSTRRRPRRRALAATTAAVAIVVPALVLRAPAVVTAYDTPTVAAGKTAAAGFLPAPNPLTYCASTEYFGFWTLNELASRDEIPPQTVYEDYAYTNDDRSGPVARFNATQIGSNNGGALTPSVGPATNPVNGRASGLPSIGIVMNGPTATTPPAGGSVTLSEPLFFSQWVFTDMDLNNEGFDITPRWATPFQSYDIYAPLNNQVNAGATWNFTGSTTSLVHFNAVNGTSVEGSDLSGRAQVDFYGPILGMEMMRSGDGGSGFSTGGGCPALGVAKSASAPVWDPVTEQFTVTYDVTVNNNLPTQAQIDTAVAAARAAADYNNSVGTPTQIDVEQLQLVDSLDLTAFSGASIISVTNSSGATLTPNANFDGVTDKNLLSGTDTLLASETGTIQLVVAYTPDFASPDWADCEVSLANQALASGNAGGVPVKDESDDGTDPAAAATNGGGGTDDPTPVTFALGCDVGLSKQIVSGPTSNGDGSYNIDYKLTAVNYGDVSVANPVVNDDLAAAFGADLVSSTTTSDACTGQVLAPAGTCDVDITVKVLPKNSFGPWENSATVSGNVGKDGLGPALTDVSQDGANPDPDGDGPGNNSDPTTTSLVASIGLAKSVSAGPTNNGDGTYNAEYTLVVENTGTTDLPNVVVDDDLSATFGPTLTSSSTTSDTCTGIVLAPAATCEIVIAVTLTPGSALKQYDNSATVTAGTGSALVTDTSQNGVDPDPDGDGDPTNNGDPTPLVLAENPQVGIAKTISDGPTNNGDGTYTLTYSLVASNTGDVNLENVVIDDDLSATFGSVLVSSTITSDTCASGKLAVGATCTQTLKVVVKPGDALGPYNNSATVSGISPGGKTVDDVSQNGTDADPDGDGDPTNNNDPTPVSFAENPVIGLTKDITAGPTNNGDGTYDLTYTLVASNTGDVDLTSVAITDDVAAVFGDAFVSATIGTDTCTGITLKVGKTCTLTLDVVVKPGANFGPYDNTATVDAVSPAGTNVNDVSQDGTNADPDGDGDPTNNSDPTPVSFAENPQIGLTKDITDGPVNNGDGTYDLTYTLVATNSGDVDLTSVAIDDDVAGVFGDAFVSATIGTDTCTGITLAVGASCTLTLDVVVKPGANFGPYDNTATVTGVSPGGTTVTDVSQDGTDADPDGDDDPTNNSDPTPVSFTENPQIGLSKSITAGPTGNKDGTYSLTYTLVATNSGDVDLADVVLDDDLAATYGDKLVSSTTTSDTCNGQTLAVGKTCTMIIDVVVKPGPDLGPYNNSADVTGTSPGGAAVSDVSQNGTNADPDGNGDPTDNNDPTPAQFVEVAQIGLAKQIATLTSNGNGSYTVTYEFIVTNTGEVPLDSVLVVDNLDATFGDTVYKVDSVDASTGQTALVANADFTGAPGAADTVDTDDLVDGSTALAVGDSATIQVAITFKGSPDYGPFTNTAQTSGVPPSGKTVSDTSTDGANVDPDGDGNTNDDSVPTTFRVPAIGLTKAVVSSTSNGDGTYDLVYRFNVTNMGKTIVKNTQVVDDLNKTFADAASFSVVSIESSTLTVNPAFNGQGDTNMLAGTDTLAVKGTGAIDVKMLVTPGANLGPYVNSAEATGVGPDIVRPDGSVIPGLPVSDVSQNQSADQANPDINGDGDATDDNVPTPVLFGEAGQIGVTKALTEGPIKNAAGLYQMTFVVVVKNTGTVTLRDVVANDDLAQTFGASATATVTSITASAPGTVNTAYNGYGNTSLLSGTTLQPGESTTITMKIDLKSPASTSYKNVATATGTTPSGAKVEDSSQNQDATHNGPDTDGDGITTDNNDPTPVVIPADPTPELPSTGSEIRPFLVAGGLLLLSGLVALLWARRRRRTAAI